MLVAGGLEMAYFADVPNWVVNLWILGGVVVLGGMGLLVMAYLSTRPPGDK
jgi:hypothetical protein